MLAFLVLPSLNIVFTIIIRIHMIVYFKELLKFLQPSLKLHFEFFCNVTFQIWGTAYPQVQLEHEFLPQNTLYSEFPNKKPYGLKGELKRNFKKNGSQFLSENEYFCRYG